VAALDQVRRHRAADLGMVEADLREAADLPILVRMVVPNLDHRRAAGLRLAQQRQCALAVSAPGDDDGARKPAHHCAQLRLFARRRVVGGGQQHLAARALQRIGQALHGFGKDRIGNARDQRRDHARRARAAAGQHAGLLVRQVAGGSQRLRNRHSRGGGHAVRLAQIARDGDRGDASRRGHVGQRGAAMAAPRGSGFQGWRRDHVLTNVSGNMINGDPL
jgi:hypothetical protein